MIVFTMDIGELIGLAITGVLVVILIVIYIYERLSDSIDRWKSKKSRK